MKIELRADQKSMTISGYVNAVERKSRPVITPHGKCVEVIENRAFEKTLEKNGNISITVDHDNTHIYGSTSDGTLKLYEDEIGLHADALIVDENLIALAKEGKIKGWSFGMYNVVDELETRADDIPVRHIKSLDLDHITLVVNKNPFYSATSVECRASGDVEIEERAFDTKIEINVPETKIDLSEFKNRLKAIKEANL